MHACLAAVLGSAVLIAASSSALAESGIASVYAYSGSKTASGERANPGGLTAAHRTLPFGTQVRVTNKRNGNSVVVRINDRGPFIRGRVIDVTPAAARALGFSGLAPVSLESSGGTATAGSGASGAGLFSFASWSGKTTVSSAKTDVFGKD